MATSAPLAVPPLPSPVWRGDLEPNALPPTDDLSAGQRRVLGASLGLFAAKGFVAATTRDIAAELGIQAPSLYNHFPTKESILERLVTFGWEYAHSRLLSALADAGSSATGRLDALVREHVTMSCEYPRLVLVIASETAHLTPEGLAVVRNHRQATRDLLAQVLLHGQDDGSFRLVHIGTTMWTLAAMGQSAAAQYPYQPALQMADLAEEFVELAHRLTGVATAEAAAGLAAARPEAVGVRS